MHTFRIAWRNLWRNHRRTAISLSAMTVSTAALIVVYALILGLGDGIAGSVTRLGVAEVQVHARGWLGERALHLTVHDPDAVLAAARAQGFGAAPRTLGVGLLSVGPRSAGAQIWGVDPAAEATVGDLTTHLAAGAFLGAAAEKKVVLGRKLARALRAEPGTELVVVVQAADGSMGTELWRVAGVLRAVTEVVDRGAAFVHQDDAQSLFAAPGRVHEIAISAGGLRETTAVKASIAPAAPLDDVRTWQELLPAAADFFGLWKGVARFVAFLFFLAAGLGILNTNLMAAYERTWEFGLVKALGAHPGRILAEVAAEASLVAGISCALGLAIGVPTAWYLREHGIDLSGFTGTLNFSGVSMEPLWRARLSAGVVIEPIVVTVLVSFLAALYPAGRAAGLDPIEAMNRA